MDIVTTRIIVGRWIKKMSKVKNFFRNLWREVDPIIELTIYVTIAFTISKLVSIPFMWGMAVVFGYFLLNIIRILAEVMRDRYKK